MLFFCRKMETHLKIIGILLMILGLIHFVFPKYFNWKEDLADLSLINRQMMYIHTFFIALIIFIMGLLCLTSSRDLINTTLGRKISAGLFFFWFLRLLIQLFGYSKKLWQKKKLETMIHVLFLLFWTYLSIIFLIISNFLTVVKITF